MRLSELISADAILPSLKAGSKKSVLLDMSEAAGQISGLKALDIVEAVQQRERLGSTGIGGGIAIPHGKLPHCDRIFGMFARLEKPIDFDAVDGAPVDMVFMLIASEAAGADHLKALARVARLFRDPQLAVRLRSARDAASIFAMLSHDGTASHAA